MDTQETKQLVLQAYDQFKRGDIAAMLESYTDDVVWEGPEVDGVPFSGTYHGKEGVRDFFMTMARLQDYTVFDLLDVVAEDNKVVVIGRSQARIKESGKTVDTPWIHVITLRGDKVMRFQHLTDTAAGKEAYMSSATMSSASAGTSLTH